MDKMEIQMKINYYNNLLENCYTKKSKISYKLSEVECLERKFNSLSNEFLDEQECRKRKLARVFDGNPINAVKKYYLGMDDLLNGSKAYKINNGVQEGKRRIVFEIRELEAELNETEQQIKSCYDNLEYWENQYRNYKEP